MPSYMPQAITDQWATPQALFDEWDAKYNFDLDPAASLTNHKCDLWYGLDHPDPDRRDGLAATWQASAAAPMCCGTHMRQVYHAPGISFKGKGWGKDA
jgi:hypothetical protein